MKDTRIALVVGHNLERQGSKNTLGQTEYTFNSWVAYEMMNLYKDSPMSVFFRLTGLPFNKEIRSVYSQVDEWGADISIELHFNSFHIPEVKGTEVLSSGSEKSMQLAECFMDEIFKQYRTTAQEYRGVKIPTKKEAGWKNLHVGKAPAIILEPFFGSNKEDCELFSNPAKLAKTYINAIEIYKSIIK